MSHSRPSLCVSVWREKEKERERERERERLIIGIGLYNYGGKEDPWSAICKLENQPVV